MQSTTNDIVCNTFTVKNKISTPTISGINCETLNVNIVGVVNSNILMTYINNVSFTPITLILLDPKSNMLKYIYILPSAVGFPITVQTSSGTFQLNGEVQLVFCSGIWYSMSGNTPVVPRISTGPYTDPTSSPIANQGVSVSLSGDGNILAYGGPSDNFGKGAAWIWVRDPVTNIYSQQAKLIATSISLSPNQGTSVSLSKDATTLAVGGTAENGNIGAAWIWVRNPITNVWTQQAELSGAITIGTPRQGNSVSLSSDGNTLAVGGPTDSVNRGAIWIWTRAAGVWNEQFKIFDVASPTARQGSSVSLSADGNTLAYGGPNDGVGNGAAWIYTRTAGIWSQQQKITVLDNIGASQLGSSVSLSANGSILAIGGNDDNLSVGATWVWVRNPSTGVWSQQAKLVGTGNVGSPQQGISVSLSTDGITLATGGIDDNGSIGATWIFTQVGGVWSQAGSKLVGTGFTGTPQQGRGVALSSSGAILAVGGQFNNAGKGAVWIFLNYIAKYNIINFVLAYANIRS